MDGQQGTGAARSGWQREVRRVENINGAGDPIHRERDARALPQASEPDVVEGERGDVEVGGEGRERMRPRARGVENPIVGFVVGVGERAQQFASIAPDPAALTHRRGRVKADAQLPITYNETFRLNRYSSGRGSQPLLSNSWINGLRMAFDCSSVRDGS